MLCIRIKPQERSQYPHLMSKTELRKIGLMPKKNVKPRALVCRAIYGNHYLYDRELTCPYKKTLDEKKREKKRREERRKEKEREITMLNRKTFMHSALASALEEPVIPFSNPSGIICFDLETTGLSPDAEILQISIIDGNGNVLLNEYVKPYYTDTWVAAQVVNQISPGMVENAPYLHELVSKIRGIFNSADVWIAYNADFDLGFVRELGVVPGNDVTVVDVMLEFAPIYGELTFDGGYKWKSLQTCADYYHFSYHAHNSLEDVRATLYCYNKIKEEDFQ